MPSLGVPRSLTGPLTSRVGIFPFSITTVGNFPEPPGFLKICYVSILASPLTLLLMSAINLPPLPAEDMMARCEDSKATVFVGMGKQKQNRAMLGGSPAGFKASLCPPPLEALAKSYSLSECPFPHL